MFSSRTSQFIDRRLGEARKDLTQDEKYSNRLRVLRKKQTSRASKYSLEKEETDLTHFGKRIGDMLKSEIKQAYIGEEDVDERSRSKKFSYDDLIAESKEQRAAARRQKMEAEAELDDLDSSFKEVFGQLERRDMDKDKFENLNGSSSHSNQSDDLLSLVRSFQSMNSVRAVAGDRTVTLAEQEKLLKDQREIMARQRDVTLMNDHDEELDENEDEEGSVFSSDDEANFMESSGQVVDMESTTRNEFMGTDPIALIQTLVASPETVFNVSKIKQLCDMLRNNNSESDRLNDYFKENLFTPVTEVRKHITRSDLVLMKLASKIFPLDFHRHCIVIPIIKLLEQFDVAETVSLVERGQLRLAQFVLLFEFVTNMDGSSETTSFKYSPKMFKLAGELFRSFQSNDETRNIVLQTVARYCSGFTRESLDGVLSSLFPEIIANDATDYVFEPLKLHHFKPVEVLSLEPAFHEEGDKWNGEHKELRAAKKLQQQFKQEKRLTMNEMRKEAVANETLHAIETKKKKAALETQRKRNITKMNEAENNFRLIKTDNGKEDKKPLKNNKKKRVGGNKH